jgi:hypothetical protein
MRLFLTLLAILIFSHLTALPVFACVDEAGATVKDASGPISNTACCQDATYKALPGNSGLCAAAGNVSGGPSADLQNPISANSVPELIGNIIKVALGIVGSLALIMFIYGGFTWMLAAGNEQSVEKGKNILLWATIGLVVIFASYSLVSFVIMKVIVGG